jgi:Tfp pilus tip-associated adhesin PilY1
VKTTEGQFVFVGVVDGAELEARIAPTGTLRYAFVAKAVHANLTGTTNPVTVRLSIGADSGTTSVTAHIHP